MNIQTYLYFKGDCSEAIEFYGIVFPATLEFSMKYGEGSSHLIPDGWSDKIFHATLKIGDTLVNLADMKDAKRFSGFSMLVHAASADQLQTMFGSLQEGGSVLLPVSSTPWAECYGIVTDRFGITWKLQLSL